MSKSQSLIHGEDDAIDHDQQQLDLLFCIRDHAFGIRTYFRTIFILVIVVASERSEKGISEFIHSFMRIVVTRR